MEKTAVALYDTLTQAQKAVQDLVNDGFQREDISLVANDVAGEYAPYVASPATRTAREGDVTAAEGASFGAVVGALTGAVVTLGTLMIPGIGPVIAAGPLLAGLTGAGVGLVAGAATGGVTAALVKTGVPVEEAGAYAQGVREGGTLVSVHTDEAKYDRARDILNRYHPINIQDRSGAWRQQGWSGFNEATQPLTAEEIRARRAGTPTAAATESKRAAVGVMPHQVVFDELVDDCRRDFETNYDKRGYTFEQFLPAYRYGYALAYDPRYTSKNWVDAEADAQRAWEERNPNFAWDTFKGAVHYAWNRARIQATAAS